MGQCEEQEKNESNQIDHTKKCFSLLVVAVRDSGVAFGAIKRVVKHIRR